MVYYGSLHLAPHHLTLWSQSNAHLYNPLFYCKCILYLYNPLLYCKCKALCIFTIYNSRILLGCKRWIDLVVASLKFEGYNEKLEGGMHLVHFSFLNWFHTLLIFNASCSPFILKLTIHFKKFWMIFNYKTIYCINSLHHKFGMRRINNENHVKFVHS
jgi:hypothetical protein